MLVSGPSGSLIRVWPEGLSDNARSAGGGVELAEEVPAAEGGELDAPDPVAVKQVAVDEAVEAFLSEHR